MALQKVGEVEGLCPPAPYLCHCSSVIGGGQTIMSLYMTGTQKYTGFHLGICPQDSSAKKVEAYDAAYIHTLHQVLGGVSSAFREEAEGLGGKLPLMKPWWFADAS
jgi:hypothetical protein